MKNNVMAWVGNTLGVVFTIVQGNEILQWISFGITVTSVIVSLAFSIWKWVKEAKKDGEITPDEIEKGAKVIVDGLDNVKKVVEKAPVKDSNDVKEIEKK